MTRPSSSHFPSSPARASVRTMQATTWTSVFGVAGQLALAIYVLARPRIGPSSPPPERSTFAAVLGVLCLTFAAWTFAAAAHAETGVYAWHLVDLAFSPFVPPLGLALVASFVGASPPRRRRVMQMFVPFVGLSLTSVAAAFSHTAREFVDSWAWPVVYLLAFFPTIAVALYWLQRHRRRTPLAERPRVDGIRAGLIVGAALALTEFMADLGLEFPRLGHVASLTTAATLVWLGHRHELLPRPKGLGLVALALAAGAVLATTHSALIVFLPADDAMRAIAATLFSAFGLVVVGAMVGDVVRRRSHRSRLAYQGRMASQLAHDLRNPLAALLGAVDLLEHERERGELASHDLLQLLRRQAARLQATTEVYLRGVSVAPRVREVDLDALIEEVLAPMPDVDAHNPPGTIEADPDLLVPALQNLLRNASDVSAEVRLRVRLDDDWVHFEVEDEGPGWTPTARQLATEGFFTTKASGTGLGVSFAHRVADAHGGQLELGLRGRVEGASMVVLSLPRRSPADPREELPLPDQLASSPSSRSR